MFSTRWPLLATALWLALPAVAAAHIVPTPRPLPPGTPPGIPQSPIVLESVQLQVDIEDGVAVTRVTEEIRNLRDVAVEAQFVFPIPRGAVVHDAALRVGDTWVEAEVLGAEEARGAYREIVRRAIDPALIEYAGDGLLRTHVFPVPASGRRELQLSLSMTLPEDFGTWAYHLPLRLLCGGQGDPQVTLEGRVRSSRSLERPYSPTHDLETDVSRDGRTATFSLETSGREAGAHDLQVFFPNRGDDLTVTALSTRPAGEDGYVLLRVSPGAAFDAVKAASKRIVFVLDTSGSMQGEKLEQAKAALRYALQRMDAGDRFAVVTYASTVRPLTERLVRATPANVRDVLEELKATVARGGTNIEGALREGLSLAAGREGDPTYVLFLTDGLATVGEKDVSRLLAKAAAANAAQARVFTFGVGHDVNTRLLDGLARESRAVARYVLPGEELEIALSHLYDQIAEPLWTDLRLELPGAGLYDLAPPNLQDLFRGGTLNVLARYRRGGNAELKLSGEARGRRRTEAVGVRLAHRSSSHDYLPRLWAGRRLAFLQQELRAGGDREELMEEIVELGTKYGIVTEYTSLLMREPDAEIAEALREGRPRFEDLDAHARRRGGGRAGLFSAPEAESGAPAVTRAADEGRLAQAQSMSSATRVLSKMSARFDAAAPGAAPAELVRAASRRVFHRDADGRWVDALATGATPRLTVAAFSDAWFELAELRPELAEALALGSKLLVVIDGDVLAVADEGVEQLDAAARAWITGG